MKTMLIVDDSSYMRDVIKVFAGKLNIDVIGEAESGKDGVEQYIKLMPDIVILDLIMDDVDGLEALKKIRGHNPDAAVIMISSTAKQIDKEATLLGAKKVFKKPIDKKEFMDYLSGLSS
jgi:two-component system chemotaxis response regulator CheY